MLSGERTWILLDCFPKDLCFSKVKVMDWYYFCSRRSKFCLWEQRMRAKGTIQTRDES